ncbi:MAG: alpha/beta hydrolase, partial [Planctomycetota bacterium]|nr:alpha/beta hydrolase [Planctomycetota bacterium]
FRSLARRTRMIAAIDLRDAVRSLRVPLTVAHGGRDRVVPRGCFEELCRLRPDARRLFWPEAGHNVSLSHPDSFTELVGA